MFWPNDNTEYSGKINAVNNSAPPSFGIKYDDGTSENHPIADTAASGLRVRVLVAVCDVPTEPARQH